MYIYIYIYISWQHTCISSMCICTHIHTYTQTCIPEGLSLLHTRMSSMYTVLPSGESPDTVATYMCMYTSVYVCKSVCMYLCVHMYVCIQVRMHCASGKSPETAAPCKILDEISFLQTNTHSCMNPHMQTCIISSLCEPMILKIYSCNWIPPNNHIFYTYKHISASLPELMIDSKFAVANSFLYTITHCVHIHASIPRYVS